MLIQIIINITSMIIWFCVPLRHYKTNYFYFFIILGIADPIKLLLFLTLKISVMKGTPLVFLFLIFSLLNKKYLYVCLIISLIYFIALFIINFLQNDLMEISFILQIVISVLILYRILHLLNVSEAINLFQVILMTYILINIFKYLAVLLNFEQGIVSFYLGTFSQIFFGIIFLFINEKTKNFNLISTAPDNITLL
jgi:hypothetical protein